MSVETDDENAWFIDSSASTHMSCNRYWYDAYYEKYDGTHIDLGDKRSHKALGYGVISVNLTDGQFKQIHNVMYVLGIKNNLIFVFAITNTDMKVEFDKYKFHVKDVQDHYRVIATRSRLGGLYKLDVIKGNHQELEA